VQRRARKLVLVVGALLVGACGLDTRSAGAQELEPRAYVNTPIGVNFLIAGYGYQEGDVLNDPGLPLRDGKVTLHTAVAAYARSFALLGRSAKLDLVLPWAWADGSATFEGMAVQRSIDGLGDPRLRVSWNFIGAPALTMEEYRTWKQRWIVGASLAVSVPLGQYDSERLLNIGSNRWSFKPEFGISRALADYTLELKPSVALYTDNTDYFGGARREQNPLWSLQGNVVYRFHPAVWGSIDTVWYFGGRSAVDGERNDDRQSNVRFGATLTVGLSRHFSLKAYASTAAHTRRGGDYSILGVAAQARWGAGL
jgi:hypothetical protein